MKGLVPQPILRKCLDKMVAKSNDNPFADEEEDGKEGDDDEEEEEEEEMWELKKILTVEEISTRNFMCNGVGCPNVACSVYQSTHDTNCVNAWFSCLDCQELCVVPAL